MGKNRKDELDYVVEETVEPSVPVSSTSVLVEPLLTFDRFFLSLGRPMHHKKGIAAYVKNIKGKKTVAAWNALLKGY